MTIGGRLVSLFPVAYLIAVFSWIACMLMEPRWWSVPALLAIVYLLPLICFRAHRLFFRVEEGASDLSLKKYSPWWANHMFQYPFIAVPAIEGLIHCVPGLFSIWLRAWGSKVGRGVHWTPKVEVVDRDLIEVGDRVVIGHLTAMCAHMVAEIDGKPMLVLKKIRLGSGSFIGADSQFGPGADIAKGSRVKPKTRLYWRGEWP